MTTLLIFGLILFISYCMYMVYLNNDVPESISETSYICKREFNITWPFTVFCIVIAVCIFPLWVTVSPIDYQFLVFLGCAGIIFAGCSPLFKEEIEKNIHYTSGVIAFISGLIWFLLTSNWMSLVAIFIIGGFWTCFDKHKYTFIFEYVSLITLCLTLLSF